MIEKFLIISIQLSLSISLITFDPSSRQTLPPITSAKINSPQFVTVVGLDKIFPQYSEIKHLPPTPAELGESLNPYIDETYMVYIPSGEFYMGAKSKKQSAKKADPAVLAAERPEHIVYLDDFWIDRTEVTNQLFAAFLNEMGNQEQVGETWFDADSDHARIHQMEGIWKADPGFEHHPVVEVNWFGANNYCRWLDKRLPTEAEWEKAGRWTDGRKFPWGENISCELANYLDCGGDTVPVLSLIEGASPYGVLHMSGNAWEWVADWFDEDYYGTSPDRNPAGPPNGSHRVVRSGCAMSAGAFLRSTYRDKLRPNESGFYNGFRCVYSP